MNALATVSTLASYFPKHLPTILQTEEYHTGLSLQPNLVFGQLRGLFFYF